MKKHPVDDLFKRRLGDLERKPSDNAWLKIQQNTQARRRPAVWIWYAAASIAIALTAGYLVWKNEQKGLIEQTGSQKTVASVGKKENITPIEKAEERDTVGVRIAARQNEISKKVKAQHSRQQKDFARLSFSPVQKQEEKQIEQAIAEVEKMSLTQNSIAPIETPKSHETGDIRLLTNKSALPDISKEKKERAITIVVAVESDGDEMEDKPKSSRFSRVFRQLKNARAGERVDWEEVGFNPKDLVARVDDRLRNKEEKVSERNQNPKERTKL